MANDKEFVKQHLDELREPEGFAPDAARARLRVRGQSVPRRSVWKWAAVPAAVALMLALLLPVGHAVARMDDGGGFSLHQLHAALLAHWNGLVRLVHRLPFLATADPARAPDFQLTDAAGKSIRLSDYRGKVVLLNFWATWCEPCKAEVPWFVDLQKAYTEDLVVLGVSFDEDGWKSVRPFIEDRRVNYPVMLAGPELPERYRKIGSLPATLMIDRDGRIAGTHLGLTSKAQYEALIREQL